MALSTISFSGFVKSPDFNILIPTSYLVIDEFSNINMLITKSLTRSWQGELNTIQMTGIPIERPGLTWSPTYHIPEDGFGLTFNDITKDTVFYTTTSRFVAWLVFFSPERQGLWLPTDDLKNSA